MHGWYYSIACALNYVTIIQINEHLCKLAGVEERLTSAYHPQTNGLDERFNQTLQRQLLKFVEGEQEQWDLYLDSILFSYRVSKQDSTKYSPFFLVYGRQARLPIEFNLKPNHDSGTENQDLNGNDSEAHDSTNDQCHDLELDDCIDAMITVRKKALENIGVAQKKQKAYYDAKHCKDRNMYKEGTLVLLKNSRKLSRKGSKLEPNWTGPYRISEVAGKGTFKLCDPNDHKKIMRSLYNMTRQKLYQKREDSKIFQIGTVVLLKDLRKAAKKGSEQNWNGPYKICAVVGKDKFRLCECHDDKKKLAPLYKANRLKLYEVKV